MFGFLKKKPTTTEISKKNSNEPWVQVIGEHVDPKQGIRIELDWNDAFVEYLKQNGYTGVNDETIVQKWLAQLYQHLIDGMNPTQKNTFE